MKYGEKYADNKRFNQSFFFATLLHIVLGIVFYFATAWKVQDPPIANPGIEIAFDVQDLGQSIIQHKDVETPESVTESESIASTKPIIENSVSKNITKPVNTAKAIQKQENILTQKKESIPVPVKTKKKKIESKAPIKKTKTTKKKTKPSKKASKVNESFFFKKKKKKNQLSKKTNATKNNGNKGDKGLGGNEKSSINGASLNLSGWKWEHPPSVYDESAEQGKIVFKITIDEFGNLLQVVTIERTVTPQVEQKYINAVKKLSFHSIGNARTKKGNSTGHITFFLKTK